ncbi:hypothetical protein D3C80_1236920 [compost metagenome]
MLAPVCCILQRVDGDAVKLAVRKPQSCQLGEAFGLLLGAVRPAPHEQADSVALCASQLLACEQPGHGTPGVGAACLGLHMIVQAQIQLTLQVQVDRLGQLPGDSAELWDVSAPVMAVYAVPPAGQLHQSALLVGEGNGYAVDLGLYPHAALAGHPSRHGLAVCQLVDAGMRHGVGDRAASAGQGGGAGANREALLQVVQALAALVVQFVGHQGYALAMVVLVPSGKRGAQLRNFGLCLLRLPVGA